jgi:hypothetical protein
VLYSFGNICLAPLCKVFPSNLAQIPSPDCNEKPCAAQADFFLAEPKRPVEALGAALKKRVEETSLE